MSDLMLSAVLNMPLPDDPSQMDVLTWMQFRDRARQSADEINRLRAENERLQHLSHCCVCGNPVDTREECDGGGPDGCQLTDDRWVCTSECWDKVVKTIDLQNELDRLRAENERLVDMLNWAYDTLREINISNYDHDDVCSLNAASVEVILGINAALQAKGDEE